MGRPVYETTQDRAAEREIRRLLAKKWQCEVVPTPELSAYDAVIRRGGPVVGMVEIKRRRVHSAEYQHIILSKAKVDKICRLARGSQVGVKALFVVQFNDKLMGIELEPERYTVGKGGRTDRGDPADVELVYEIPTDWFNLIARR